MIFKIGIDRNLLLSIVRTVFGTVSANLVKKLMPYLAKIGAVWHHVFDHTNSSGIAPVEQATS